MALDFRVHRSPQLHTSPQHSGIKRWTTDAQPSPTLPEPRELVIRCYLPFLPSKHLSPNNTFLLYPQPHGFGSGRQGEKGTELRAQHTRKEPMGKHIGGTRRAEKGQHEKCTSAQQSRSKAPLLEVHHRGVSTPAVSQQDPSSGGTALSPPPRAQPHTHTHKTLFPEREGSCPHPTASQLPDASSANVHLSRAGEPSP